MNEVLIGIVSGIVGGLGMGGGTVLILLLSVFFNMEQHIAQSTNVIFFVPTAIAAIIVSLKNKNVSLKIAVPICLWGIIGAFIGAYVATHMNMGMLKRCFGGFLILIAIYQTYEYIKAKRRHNNIKQ